MAKDPAFLFYSSDFLTGTMFMSNEQVGLYIRLLCAQHQHGGRIDTNVLRAQCDSITNGASVYSKFQHDESGSYSLRLEKEMLIRKEKGLKAKESVNKRWEKHRNESNTNVLRSESVNESVNETGIVIRDRGAGERVKIKTDTYGLFEPLVKKWIDYKKVEHRETYKTQATLDEFVKKLIDYSGGDFHRAEKIIDNSIANRWKGIFPEKPNGKPEPKKEYHPDGTEMSEQERNLKGVLELIKKKHANNGSNS